MRIIKSQYPKQSWWRCWIHYTSISLSFAPFARAKRMVPTCVFSRTTDIVVPRPTFGFVLLYALFRWLDFGPLTRPHRTTGKNSVFEGEFCNAAGKRMVRKNERGALCVLKVSRWAEMGWQICERYITQWSTMSFGITFIQGESSATVEWLKIMFGLKLRSCSRQCGAFGWWPSSLYGCGQWWWNFKMYKWNDCALPSYWSNTLACSIYVGKRAIVFLFLYCNMRVVTAIVFVPEKRLVKWKSHSQIICANGLQ